MVKRSRLLLILVLGTLALILVVGGGAFLVWRTAYPAVFRRAQSAYARKKYVKAQSYLLLAARKARSAKQEMPVTKLSYDVAKSQKSYRAFTLVSRQAYVSHAQSKTLRDRYLSALILAGKRDQAQEVIDKSPDDLGIYQVWNAAYRASRLPAAQQLPDLVKHVTADSMEQTAMANLSLPLLANSAMLYNKEGRRSRAYELLADLPSDILPSAVIARVLFQARPSQLIVNGFERASSSALAKDSNYYQLLAEMELVLGNKSRAQESYETVLVQPGQPAPSVYENLAELYILGGKTSKAFDTISQRLSKNGASLELISFALDNLYAYYPAETRALIKNQNLDGMPGVGLKFLRRQGESMDAKQFQSQLWLLFSRFSTNIYITQYALWYFIGAYEFDQARIIQERFAHAYQAKEGSAPPAFGWNQNYTAIIADLTGHPDRSINLLKAMEKADGTYYGYYNLGLVYGQMKKYDLADQALASASRLAQGIAPARDQSKLLAVQARISALRGEIGVAREQLKEAAQKDSTNLLLPEVDQEIQSASQLKK